MTAANKTKREVNGESGLGFPLAILGLVMMLPALPRLDGWMVSGLVALAVGVFGAFDDLLMNGLVLKTILKHIFKHSSSLHHTYPPR
jgi:hypothetical protein